MSWMADAPRPWREEAVMYGAAFNHHIRSIVEAVAPHLVFRPIEETFMIPEAAVEAAADRAKLVEALFYGYKVLGFDTDGCETGVCYLGHCGLGGNNLDAFIAEMKQAFKDARADHDEALQ